jgi:D-3-phosphoglycerate dehydrogenase / 2-oxoglutarate reductase
MADIVVVDPGAAPTAGAARRLIELGHPVEPVESPAAGSARVLLAGGFADVGEELLARLPALELVVRPGAGFERVDLAALRRRGVRLVAARLASDTSVAEWVMGAVIHHYRRFAAADRAARAGDWAARPALAGRSLAALTLGIVGVGRIGTQVAAAGHAFGMRVVAWHPWSDRELGPGIDRMGSLEQLLASADVVTLHCRLEPETKGLIGARQLAAMKPGAILVNTGRGGLVDEAALADVLRSGRLGGAAIDTIAGEPRTELSPLAGLDRVLLAPHLSGWTTDSVEGLAAWAVNTIAVYLAGGELPADSIVS